MRVRTAPFCLGLLAAVPAQEVPKVTALSPPQYSCDVDAASVKTLTVTFDQVMNTDGFSFCGNEPGFPKIVGRPRWQDDRTVVVDVALEPDRDYELGLNSATAHHFRTESGMVLVPVTWWFSTLPPKLPDQKWQQARNQKALALLVEAVDAHYAHRDLRVHDWPALMAAGTPALLAAKTDKAFAGAAAMLLQPAGDVQLAVRYGERTFPAATRAVDPLFRRPLLDGRFKVEAAGKDALAGRSDDGIGYLMVGAWTKDLDFAAIDKALAALRDCKAMVIDARANCGGDEALAQRVAAWFVDGRKVYARHRVRVKAGKYGFAPVTTRALSGNSDRKQHFPGPIAVLTSRYVMGANESFVMMLQQAAACTVVGQPTWGGNGNPKPFELGNGVTLLVPSSQDLRPDGTGIEGEGIAPDVLVECCAGDLVDGDPILDKALEVLRRKLAK